MGRISIVALIFLGSLAVAPAARAQTANFNRPDVIQETGVNSSGVTLTNYGTGFAATNWTNSDILLVTCFGR